MNRLRIIIAAVIAAFILGALPVAISLYVAWNSALSEEQAELLQLARETLKRSDRVLSESSAMLQRFAASPAARCSAEDIAAMRRAVFESRYVREIGAFIDGKLACTSWGRLAQPLASDIPPAWKSPEGFEVWYAVKSLVSQDKPSLIVKYKDYNVLIDPDHLVDIVVDNDQTSISIFGTDATHPFAVLHRPPSYTEPVFREGVDVADDGKHFHARVKSRDYPATVVVSEPRDRIESLWRKNLWTMGLLGGLGGIGMVGLVVFLAGRRLSLQGEIRHAIQRGEFVAHYQPVIDLATGACVGAEALVRWKRADGSMMQPDLFIPIAEESGLIQPITDAVIRGALRDLGDTLRRHPQLYIAVNLAPVDLRSARVTDLLKQDLPATGIAPRQIVLEATERGLIDAQTARAVIRAMHEAGHTVAIDDFGTGYSSLSYLQSLEVDVLKIDKSFVDAIGADAVTSSVIPHVIEMAKALKLKIIAEGVEHEAQAAYLREHGVQCAQGWLYSKALPAAEFSTFVADRINPARP